MCVNPMLPCRRVAARLGKAMGRWAARSALSGAVMLVVGCGGEEAPEQARDRTPYPSPAPTMTRTVTPTPTVTLSNLNCYYLDNCSPTPAATATTRTPTPTPSAQPSGNAPFSDGRFRFNCFLYGDCSPTPTATAARTPTATATAAPPPRTPGPTRSPPPSPSTGSAPTVAQLQRALVAEGALGRDWAELETGALTRERNPAVYAEFLNLVADQYLAVELHDVRNGGPEYLALLLVTKLGIPQVTAAAPLSYGTGGVRYRYTRVEDGARVPGELAAWQQGPVVVIMMIEGGRAEVCLCDLAQRQDEKVRAVIR